MLIERGADEESGASASTEPNGQVDAEPHAAVAGGGPAAGAAASSMAGSAANGSAANGSAGAAASGAQQASVELDRLRRRTRERGVNGPLLALVTAILVPFFRVYFRLQGVGEIVHVPRTGPLLLASNHRSFLDPFVIGALVRRPIYYVAKRELFARRWQAWILGGLGAFPVDRGAADVDAMATAKAVLARGECVVIFPEGTRVRPGPLGTPRRGVGRLALETGAPVVPVAVLGTEDVRAGWRIRPRKVRVCFGAQLRFSRGEHVEPSQAAGATARIWARIASQWAALGGPVKPPADACGVEVPAARAPGDAADVDSVPMSPSGKPPRAAPPPARVQPGAAIAALADRLARERDRPPVPLPAPPREDPPARPRSPYTLK